MSRAFPHLRTRPLCVDHYLVKYYDERKKVVLHTWLTPWKPVTSQQATVTQPATESKQKPTKPQNAARKSSLTEKLVVSVRKSAPPKPAPAKPEAAKIKEEPKVDEINEEAANDGANLHKTKKPVVLLGPDIGATVVIWSEVYRWELRFWEQEVTSHEAIASLATEPIFSLKCLTLAMLDLSAILVSLVPPIPFASMTSFQDVFSSASKIRTHQWWLCVFYEVVRFFVCGGIPVWKSITVVTKRFWRMQSCKLLLKLAGGNFLATAKSAGEIYAPELTRLWTFTRSCFKIAKQTAWRAALSTKYLPLGASSWMRREGHLTTNCDIIIFAQEPPRGAEKTVDVEEKQKQPKFKLGDSVMSRWSDCRSYPAVITKILENGKDASACAPLTPSIIPLIFVRL